MFTRNSGRQANAKTTREWMDSWANLTLAGMPPLDALDLSLDMLPVNRSGRALESVLTRAKQFIESGQTLTTSFRAAFKHLPQPLELALICAQASGDLGESLKLQVQRWEQEDEARQRLLKSLTYPLVVLTLSIVCWVFLSHMTRFNALPLHTDNQTLDLATILLTTGGLLLAAALIAKYKHSGQPTAWWQRAPSANLATSNFYHVIACELKAGHDLMHCLRHQPLTRTTFAGLNTPAQLATMSLNQMAAKLRHSLQAGLAFSSALELSKAPTFLVRQAHLAEHTGHLDHCFEVAAKVYSLRARQAQQRLETLLAPITLACAALILIVAYQSTLAPLYQNLGSFQ